jgi:general secretion pathway protein N
MINNRIKAAILVQGLILALFIAAAIPGTASGAAQTLAQASALEGGEPSGEPASIPASVPSSGMHDPEPATSVNPLSRLKLETFSATRERPIFSPSRRPPAPPPEPVIAMAPPPETPTPVDAPPPLTLVGTVVGPHTVALFMKTNDRSIIRLRIGEAEAGWTLRSVEPKSTMLEKHDRQVSLALPAPGAASDLDGPSGAQMSGMFPQDTPPFTPPPFDPNNGY